MAYFSNAFLDERRKQWLRSIQKIQVQANGAWYDGDISRKIVDGDNLVIDATFPQLDTIATTITASRIIDIKGTQAAYQQRTIKKVASQGSFIRVTIPLYEVEN
jgi:hypothetical protein